MKKKEGGQKGNKNAVGNNGGRPSQFKPQYVDELIAFFDIEPMRELVYERSKEWYREGKGDAEGQVKKFSEKIRHIPNKMPTLFRFARKIDVSYVTVNNWYKQGKETITEEGPDKGNLAHPELAPFSEAYDAAKEMQKEFLITIGLAGAAPPSAYIFTAKNVTDMRDKVETDVTTKGEKLGVVFLPPKAPLPTQES